MRLLAVILLAPMLYGCGGVTISTTNYYTLNGNDNRIGQTIRTDSRPDITATTDAKVEIPVSAIPGS